MSDVPAPLWDTLRDVPGPIVVVGSTDTGKSTLVAKLVKTALADGKPAAFIDGDVGQSEIGPPGMMELVEGVMAAGKGVQWRTRAQWYVGAASPFFAPLSAVAGIRRLADRAAELALRPLFIDTSGFAASAAGLAFQTALVDVLAPAAVVAVQRKAEMERWLAGVGANVVRVEAEPGVRSKPEGLRSARRAARLAVYFQDAPPHTVRLTDIPLRGTRLLSGEFLAHPDLAQASQALGCPVVHGERAGSSVALWTLGAPRRNTNKVAADLRAKRLVTLDAAFWNGRSAGFIGPDGFCLVQGVIEAMDWPSLTATIRAPLYSLAGANALSLGLLRHKPDGTAMPSVPPPDA